MSNICQSALPDLLLLLLLFSVVPCILSSARSNVTHIPGFDGELPFRLETGYVTLNEETGAELFYYFVESERNHSEDPLILWLLGGPGCSGVNGLAIDMGPIRFNVEDFDGELPSTYANPYAWTKIANMLFVDWPVGTGFSYSENVNDYYNEDVNGTRLIHTFLKKWFLVHPSFLVNTFYMGGDSYGGKLAVLVAHEIVEANEGGDLPRINIKGYLVGNPATSENVDTSTEIAHAYGLGVVSKEFYQLVVTNCAGDNYKYPKNAICAKHLNIFEGFLAEINRYSILDPICDDNPASLKQNSMARSLKDSSAKHLSSASDSHTSCITSDLLGNYWANHDLVREALHVREGTVGRFSRCKFNINANFYIRSIPSSVPYHHSLMSRGYRALVYSGDHDLKIPFLGTLAWIKSLNYTVLEPWHSWKAGGQVAGYATLFSNNLTFTTIKGGSHVAPSKMPMQCFVMFERWSSHQAL